MSGNIAARLQQLNLRNTADLAALPDRPSSQKSAMSGDESESDGGVVIELPENDQPSLDRQPSSRPIEVGAKNDAPLPSTKQPIPTKDAQLEANGQGNSMGSSDYRFIWLRGKESSFNLGSDPKISALPATVLLPINLQRIQLAPPSEHYFIPIVALSKYPYKFCNRTHMQEIASAFFDQGKFWERHWDLFYVWDIEESRPLILVRESQVNTLLKAINSDLKLDLHVTPSQREAGLVIRFQTHPRCRPRYLGRSRSRDEYYTMTNQVPPAGACVPGEPAVSSPDAQTVEEFRSIMEDAWNIQKNKSKGSKEKKKMDRLNKQKALVDQLKRAQRYLGLRPTAATGNISIGPVSAVDTSAPVTYLFDHSVVIVSVDVEAYERDHDKITEIGIATLDTRDIADTAPDKDGEAWRSKIYSRHLRIAEYAHLVNHEFVAGCPNSFFFGKSEHVSIKDAAAVIAECFQVPFCKAGQVPASEDGDCGEERTLILLGHDTPADIDYLQKVGFDPLGLANLLEVQDSAALYRAWRREQQTTKLSNILLSFDIHPAGMHNAGNDATYTLQAFLAVCVREAAIRNAPEVQKIRDDLQQAQFALEDA